MLRKYILCAIGGVLGMLAACSEGAGEAGRSKGSAGEATGGSAGSGTTGGSAGSGTTGGSSTSGAAGDGAGGDDDITDAGLEDASSDAEPPQCLGSGDACGEDAGTCCEAYACRLGKCCVPNGVWSNCLSGSDCCSGTCVQRQCTCAPRGYSCSGPGQCCSGYACVNGTCICPPDIRGC